MVHGLWTLKQLSDTDASKLEGMVRIAFILGVYAFSSLIPYTINTLTLLKPFKIIDMLGESITKESLSSSESFDIDESPILSIVDIIRSSLMRSDYETASRGIKTLESKFKVISYNITKQKNQDISNVLEVLLEKLEKIGILAINNTDEQFVLDLIPFYQLILDIVLKYNKISVINRFSLSIEILGCAASDKKLRDVVNNLVAFASNVGKQLIMLRRPDISIDTLGYSLGEIGKSTAKEGMEIETIGVVNSLGDIGLLASKNKLDHLTTYVIYELEKIGIISAHEKMEDSTKKIASILGSIGKEPSQNQTNENILKIISSLRTIGTISINEKLISTQKEVISSLNLIGIEASKQDTSYIVDQIIITLRILGKEAIDTGNITLVLEIAKIYENFTSLSIKNAFSSEMTLHIFGATLAKEGLDYETMLIANSLKDVAILCTSDSTRLNINHKTNQAENSNQKIPNISMLSDFINNSSQLPDYQPDFLISRAIDYLSKIGVEAVNQRLQSAIGISGIIEELVLKYLGSISEDKTWEESRTEINNSLTVIPAFIGNFGIALASQYPHSTRSLSSSIYEIGKYSAARKAVIPTHGSLLFLYKMGTALAKNGEDVSTQDVVHFLGNICISAIQKEMHAQAIETLQYIEEIGLITANSKMKQTNNEIISSLSTIGKTVTRINNNDLKMKIILSFETLGNLLSENKLENEVQSIVLVLKMMGIANITRNITVNEKTVTEIRRIICSLESIGLITSCQKMEQSTQVITNSIRDICSYAAADEISDVVTQAKISVKKILDVSLSNIPFNVPKIKDDLEEIEDLACIYIKENFTY